MYLTKIRASRDPGETMNPPSATPEAATRVQVNRGAPDGRTREAKFRTYVTALTTARNGKNRVPEGLGCLRGPIWP